MRIHKFEGATMRDAIAKVKAELGDEAVIISTRQVRRGLLGSAIEISAAIDEVEDARGPGPQPRERVEPMRHEPPPPAPRFTEDLEKAIAPLRSEMRSLRALVRASDGSARATTELCTEMKSEIESLRRLLETMRVPAAAAASPGEVAHPALTQGLVRPSHGKVLMLVGPTGAGKTTTIAKLAANAALVEGKRVRLVTLDNYRIGGVEQIRMFADLIGIPLTVAESPAALALILTDDDHDLTIVDTAGRSPRSSDFGASIGELADELPNLPAIEIHLVIPAASTAEAIDELVERYRPLAPARLLFTKLDEVERTPELTAAPLRTRIAITWVTTGQAVPEDIEQPTRARIHELATSGLSHDNKAA